MKVFFVLRKWSSFDKSGARQLQKPCTTNVMYQKYICKIRIIHHLPFMLVTFFDKSWETSYKTRRSIKPFWIWSRCRKLQMELKMSMPVTYLHPLCTNLGFRRNCIIAAQWCNRYNFPTTKGSLTSLFSRSSDGLSQCLKLYIDDLSAIPDAIKDKDRWSKKRSFQVCLVNARLPSKVIFLVSWSSPRRIWKGSNTRPEETKVVCVLLFEPKPKIQKQLHLHIIRLLLCLLYVIKALLLICKRQLDNFTTQSDANRIQTLTFNESSLPFTDVKRRKEKAGQQVSGQK